MVVSPFFQGRRWIPGYRKQMDESRWLQKTTYLMRAVHSCNKHICTQLAACPGGQHVMRIPSVVTCTKSRKPHTNSAEIMTIMDNPINSCHAQVEFWTMHGV
jgi:hypothetical protein